MPAVLDAQVITRHGVTVHEDARAQADRLSSELWKVYAERNPVWGKSRNEPTQYFAATDPDEDHLEALQTLRNVWVHYVWPSRGREVVMDSNELGRRVRLFRDYLQSWTDILLVINTRATTETSTLFSFLQASLHGAQHLEGSKSFEETEWTDEKNRRRCELVDMEIEGTLSAEERIELDNLQSEMLAYRRKVAPLPLRDLRRMHQELLSDVPGHSE